MRRKRYRFCDLRLLIAAIVLGLPAPSMAADQSGLLRLAGRHVKWGAASYGSAAEVTYAYLDRKQSFAGARNCASMLPASLFYRMAAIDERDFDLEVEAAFGLWSAHAAIRFRRIDRPQEADILIGAQDSSAGIAYANVLPQPSAGGPVTAIAKATICLDPSERWELGRDGDPTSYTLRRVLAHEIGHALGLDHLGRDGGLMGYAYPEPATGPLAALEPADIAAVVTLYGSPNASQVATATGEVTDGVSIDDTAPPPVHGFGCNALALASSEAVAACVSAPGKATPSPADN